ncbi:MAG: tetratricopeptide repeat protein, partial [Rubrivivax sp.]|nr:tetratricopeptide repeat protein [Pyrinomonadaceae bacterium]
MYNTRPRTTSLLGKSLLFILLALTPTPSAPYAWAQGGQAPAPPARQANTETELESGKTVEREIKGGEAHAYTVTLRRGEFLRAVATSQDVDVLATVYRPGGEKLLASDLLKYPGPEPLSFVAEREGVYRLEVSVAGTQAVRGRYVLTSEMKAAATEADKERLAAEGVLREAMALEREGSKESLDSSVERYGEGARRWRGARDKFWEAFALHYSGRASSRLGEQQKALEFYNQALALRRAVGDREGEATTLNDIGAVYRGLGELQKALEFLNLALPLRRAVGDRAGEALTLDNLMELHRDDLAAPPLAIFYGKQAVNTYQQLRGNIQGMDKETQKTYLKTVEKHYRQLADLLLSQGRLPEAE